VSVSLINDGKVLAGTYVQSELFACDFNNLTDWQVKFEIEVHKLNDAMDQIKVLQAPDDFSAIQTKCQTINYLVLPTNIYEEMFGSGHGISGSGADLVTVLHYLDLVNDQMVQIQNNLNSFRNDLEHKINAIAAKRAAIGGLIESCGFDIFK